MVPVIFKYFLSFIDTNPHTHITNLKRNQYNLSSHTTYIRHLFDLIYDFNTIVSNWSLRSVPFCHNSRNGETTWRNLNSFVIIKKQKWTGFCAVFGIWHFNSSHASVLFLELMFLEKVGHSHNHIYLYVTVYNILR